MRRAFALTIAAFSLAGCKVDIEADIFSSDIVAAMDGEEVTTPVTIGVELGSCEEKAPALTKAIQANFQSVEHLGCKRKDFDQLAYYRLQIPITALKAGDTKPASPLGIVALKTEDGGYNVILSSMAEEVTKVWRSLPGDMTEYTKFNPDPALSVSFNNDLRNRITIVTEDVFMDGTPAPTTLSHELDRRGQVALRMSDVTNAFFALEGLAHAVSFTEEAE